MDVKFYTTTSAKLPTLPVVNGQLIYLEDKEAAFYDMGSSRHTISGVKQVTALPSTGQANILYVRIDNDGNALASIWDDGSVGYKSVGGAIATTATLGVVKPDGTTITVSADGTISTHLEVTSLPASSITYDNTTSGTTATDAQGALDEIAALAASAYSLADTANTSASTALAQLETLFNTTLPALVTRIESLEATAARALITEDPITPSED